MDPKQSSPCATASEACLRLPSIGEALDQLSLLLHALLCSNGVLSAVRSQDLGFRVEWLGSVPDQHG